MKIQIVVEVYDDYADPEHETGLTEEAHMGLYAGTIPGDIESIERIEE